MTFEEFVENSKVKESTVRRRYKEIPGLEKTEHGFTALSGTRYPVDKRFRLKNSDDRRYILLKAISEYKYINYQDLRIEYPQFQKMLQDFLSAGLIEPNNLENQYGANAYDCTRLGDQVLKERKATAINKIADLVSKCAGEAIGTVISKKFNVA